MHLLRGKNRIAALAAAVLALACTGKGRSATAAGPRISIAPASASLATGDTQQFTATVTGAASPAVQWSVQEGASGGGITADGLYTAPSTAGTYHVVATSVADAALSAAATVSVASGALGTRRVERLAGMSHGLARTGYGGAWDSAPGAPAGQYVVAQARNQEPLGIDIGYGVLGGTRTVLTIPDGFMWHASMAMDPLNHDLHVATEHGGAAYRYYRFRPERDASGTIQGMTRTAMIDLPWGGHNIDSVVVFPIVDGAGNHRLLAGFAWEAPGSADPNRQADLYLAQTSVAAGVAPGTTADWVGLDGGAAPTYLGRLSPGIDTGGATASTYVTDIYVGQHVTSRNLEIFSSQGNHGEAGAHVRVRLVASGTTWSGVPGGTLTSYDAAGGLGAGVFATGDDKVWWAWDDGTVTRISNVDSAGNVEWNPLPSLGSRLDWIGFRSLAVTPSGTVGIFDAPLTAGDANAPRAAVRILSGGAWSPWQDLGQLPSITSTSRFTNPLQGLPVIAGKYWFGMMAISQGDNEDSCVAAAALADAP